MKKPNSIRTQKLSSINIQKGNTKKDSAEEGHGYLRLLLTCQGNSLLGLLQVVCDLTALHDAYMCLGTSVGKWGVMSCQWENVTSGEFHVTSMISMQCFRTGTE